MSVVKLSIGGHGYELAVRDGQEAHFLALAETVDARCREAITAAGRLTESRQLLFAALLLADAVAEARSQRGDAQRACDAAIAEREALRAERATLLADRDAAIVERDAARAAHLALEAEHAATRPEAPDPSAAIAIERLAERIEALADGLEKRATAP